MYEVRAGEEGWRILALFLTFFDSIAMTEYRCMGSHRIRVRPIATCIGRLPCPRKSLSTNENDDETTTCLGSDLKVGKKW